MIHIHAFVNKDDAWDFAHTVVNNGGTVLDYGVLDTTEYSTVRERYYIKYSEDSNDKSRVDKADI